jgi:hypothetical protein|tara:strand:+ start:92 stop:502 length:411 start_codon:yes stop_codon:yes gene_type:complete
MGRVFFDTRKNVQDQDGAYTILSSDSGKTFMLSSSGGACEITLPVAANLEEGSFYKFIVKEDTPTGVITIAAGSAILDGVQKDAGGDAANSSAGTAVSNLVIGTATKQGDSIDIFTDGTTYYFECLSSTNNSITTS